MDEEQFILRLPQALVESMRFALSSTKRRDAAGEDKKASNFSITLKDERNGVFTLDGVEYPATVMDLPTLVESHKTADKRTFYKSSDIHQVLVVRMPDDPVPESTALEHGLTPAAQHAGRRFVPQTKLFSPTQVESVERRVKMVIDHKVKLVPKSSAPKKDLPEQRPAGQAEEMEVVIEEDTTAAPGGGELPQPAKPGAPSMQRAPPFPSVPSSVPFSAPASTPLPSVAPSPAPSPDVHPSPLPTAATPSVATPGAATPGAVTPLPEAEGGEEEEEDDVDDFAAEMAGALMEANDEDDAQKRIERANLDQKIVEEKEKIAQLEARAAKAPNAVLRMRILSKRGDMQATLARLEKERAELGENA